MIAARLFYFVYFTGFSLFMILHLVRLLFGKEPLAARAQFFVSGVFLALFWPVTILAPSGREHIGELFAFALGRRRQKKVIDLNRKDYSDESGSR